MDGRIAWRRHPVVGAVGVLAVVRRREPFQCHDQQCTATDDEGCHKVGLAVVPEDGEAVVQHAQREKKDLWKLHQGRDGQEDVGVQAHVAQEEAVINSHGGGVQEGEEEAAERQPAGAPRPDAGALATGCVLRGILKVRLRPRLQVRGDDRKTLGTLFGRDSRAW